MTHTERWLHRWHFVCIPWKSQAYMSGVWQEETLAHRDPLITHCRQLWGWSVSNDVAVSSDTLERCRVLAVACLTAARLAGVTWVAPTFSTESAFDPSASVGGVKSSRPLLVHLTSWALVTLRGKSGARSQRHTGFISRFYR